MCVSTRLVDTSLERSALVAYSEVIATRVPPTFRGNYVKYSYKLTIGTQRVNCPTTLIRVPFRVLVLPGRCFHRGRQDGSKPIALC